MLKKLRLKFILFSMVSVFIVLAITIGAINISNYVLIESNAQDNLSEVIRIGTKEEGPDVPKKEGEREGINPRLVHYFITVYNQNGNVVDYNYQHEFMLTNQECQSLTSKVLNGEISGGKYSTYRYQKQIKNDGLTYVAFVDIKEKLDDFNNFLLSSTLISVAAYLMLFLLIFIASKIVFKTSEEAYKKQKQFITNASHELKTPLTVISTDLDLIELEHGKSEWSQSIRDQVVRLTNMTNQMVDLSRLDEEDSTNYPFDNFSVNEVYKNVVEAFSSSFKKENIKFASNIGGNITMYGNRHLIEELLYIFLDNSLKYTGGDNKSSYFVVSKNDKEKIEFRFSNTLSKDDETDIKQVMERFYRAPSNLKEGSGLGLSIAQEIINIHKGKIKIDKNDTTISFVITF